MNAIDAKGFGTKVSMISYENECITPIQNNLMSQRSGMLNSESSRKDRDLGGHGSKAL